MYGDTTHTMQIETIHPWSREKKSFEVQYDNAETFEWTPILQHVKCLNSDDTQWNDKQNRCENIAYKSQCSQSAPKCIHYTFDERNGKCSKDNPIVEQTTTVLLNKGIFEIYRIRSNQK